MLSFAQKKKLVHGHTMRTSNTGVFLLTQKLLKQSYEEDELKMTLRKF